MYSNKVLVDLKHLSIVQWLRETQNKEFILMPATDFFFSFSFLQDFRPEDWLQGIMPEILVLLWNPEVQDNSILLPIIFLVYVTFKLESQLFHLPYPVRYLCEVN